MFIAHRATSHFIIIIGRCYSDVVLRAVIAFNDSIIWKSFSSKHAEWSLSSVRLRSNCTDKVMADTHMTTESTRYGAAFCALTSFWCRVNWFIKQRVIFPLVRCLHLIRHVCAHLMDAMRWKTREYRKTFNEKNSYSHTSLSIVENYTAICLTSDEQHVILFKYKSDSIVQSGGSLRSDKSDFVEWINKRELTPHQVG